MVFQFVDFPRDSASRKLFELSANYTSFSYVELYILLDEVGSLKKQLEKREDEVEARLQEAVLQFEARVKQINDDWEDKISREMETCRRGECLTFRQ